MATIATDSDYADLRTYIERIQDLFASAEKWSKQFDAGSAATRVPITVEEEPVGAYAAEKLVISRPERVDVELSPVGCWVIGAQGRVDMHSRLGTETLVYLDDEGPRIVIELLTEDGRSLDADEEKRLAGSVPGWVLVQDRRLGLMPSLDRKLFCRLLEVLGK